MEGPPPIKPNYHVPWGSGQIQFNFKRSGGGPLHGLGIAISIGGVVWGGIDAGTNHTTYKTTKGLIKDIYKPNGQVRSARAGEFARWSKTVRGVSYGFAGAAILFDIRAVAQGELHPAKAGLNAIMTGVGLYGGPIGWAVSGTYFLIDSTIGWDNAISSIDSVTKQNQTVHGAGWNPYRMDGGLK